MADKSADDIIEQMRNELNTTKKNLDAFAKLARDVEANASEANVLLEELKKNPNLSEAQIFQSANVPKHVQRLIKVVNRKPLFNSDKDKTTTVEHDIAKAETATGDDNPQY